MTKYRMAFFGDDFTGSTDALETLEEMGVSTILFTGVPGADELNAYTDKQAIGIAGMTRAMRTAEIGEHLQGVFERLLDIAPLHVHYKVCSTFDSSPVVGSIGKAIDVGHSVFGATVIPLVVGAPYLGRYCVFGNLFARMGTGNDGVVFRLDRHPSMSQHPVTPADESDLALHLSRQTDKRIGLIDVNDLGKPFSAVIRMMKERATEGAEVVLFDALTDGHLTKIGRVIDTMATGRNRPLFSVGSSAVSKALCAAWVKEGSTQPRTRWSEVKTAGPLLVISGSRSPVTATQIEYALKNGFVDVAVNVGGERRSAEAAITAAATRATQLLSVGKSVIIHANAGPADNRISRTTDGVANRYGAALARVADDVISQFPVTRLIVAGGDTSSLSVRMLGVRAVEMVAPGVRGAPFCRVYSDRPHVDGLIVAFKGGQVGGIDYFVKMQTLTAQN